MLISLTGFAGAILNSYDRFAIPAVTPVFLNIFMIAAALLVSDFFPNPAYALAWSIVAAGIFSLLFQLPFLAKAGLLVWPKWGWRDDNVVKIRKLMLPALFGVSVSQINLLLDAVIASFLMTGSVAWLYYSDRLLEFPLGMFGIAIATVILPNLSRHHATADASQFSNTLDWAFRFVAMFGLPAMFALMILAQRLTPETLGGLVALYEHLTAIENVDYLLSLSGRQHAVAAIGDALRAAGLQEDRVEEVLERAVELQGPVRGVAMQVDRDADNGHVGHQQSDADQLPGRQVEQAVIPHRCKYPRNAGGRADYPLAGK